jgi:hypothetical protein
MLGCTFVQVSKYAPALCRIQQIGIAVLSFGVHDAMHSGVRKGHSAACIG